MFRHFLLLVGFCAMFQPILPLRAVAYENLYNVISAAGLTTNLKLALDAGDVDSYPGNGQKWLDRSGGGYDFFLGADATVSATDPAFTGNVGNQAGEYFAGDGGDYLTYDSANEAWMNAIGKAGSYSFLAVFRLASDAVFPIISNQAAAGGTFGFGFEYDPSTNKFAFRHVLTNDVTYYSYGNTALSVDAGTLPALFVVGIAMVLNADGSGSEVVHINGVNSGTTFPVDLAFAPTSQDPTSITRIMANGDASNIMPNGSRVYALAVWQGTALTSGNFTALWNALRARYGL